MTRLVLAVGLLLGADNQLRWVPGQCEQHGDSIYCDPGHLNVETLGRDVPVYYPEKYTEKNLETFNAECRFGPEPAQARVKGRGFVVTCFASVVCGNPSSVARIEVRDGGEGRGAGTFLICDGRDGGR